MEKAVGRKIAVTIGRGRLAAGLADHLRGAGREVVLFSRRADGEFRDVSALKRANGLEKFGAVLHLAWSTVPLVAEENPGIEERQDFPFVCALIAAAAQSAHAPKLVFFSTAAVYGDTGADAATEESPCRPLGRYAAAKLAAEALFASSANACVLRITNVFGAGCPLTRPQGIIPVLQHAARHGEEVRIWGDGSAVKDYIAADDLHRAVKAVFASNLRGVFNVSSGGFSFGQRTCDACRGGSGPTHQAPACCSLAAGREHRPHLIGTTSPCHRMESLAPSARGDEGAYALSVLLRPELGPAFGGRLPRPLTRDQLPKDKAQTKVVPAAEMRS